MRFCEWLNELKEKRGYTNGQISYLTGITQSIIWNHLKGCSFPSKRSFLKYLSGFRIEHKDPAELYYYFKKNEEKDQKV